MKESRMKILSMVESGKVSAEDAVKLLDAVSKTGVKGIDTSAFEDKIKVFAKNMDEMGRELGKKLEEVGKEATPAVRKVAQSVVQKTSECVDEISKAFKKDAANGDCCSENSDCCADSTEPCCDNAQDNKCCGESDGSCCGENQNQ